MIREKIRSAAMVRFGILSYFSAKNENDWIGSPDHYLYQFVRQSI
jgi:hypothetical protein